MSRPPTPPPGETWIATSRALRAVVGDSEALTRLEAAAVVYEGLEPQGRRAGGIRTVGVQISGDAGALAAAIPAGGLIAGSEAVLYDPEAWEFTPISERADPVAAMARLGSAARDAGLTVIAAPSINLARSMCPAIRLPGWRLYLDLGLAASFAPHVDVFNVQAQSLIRDSRLYADFVREASAQAHSASRSVAVTGGVSTNPPGAPLGSGVVGRAMRAAAAYVCGWWLNIPTPGPHCPRCTEPRRDHAIAALRDQRTRGRFGSVSR